MVLTELKLENFKKFDQLHLIFKPGLNIITGPNEAGKSTLRTALLLAFYALPSSVSEVVRKCASWQAEGMFTIKLNYLDGNARICQLQKDFNEKKMSYQCDDQHYKIPKAINQKLIDDIGIADEALFRLTSSLDFRSIDQFGGPADRKQVSKMISGLMSGAEMGQDVLAAIKVVEDSVKELEKGLKGQAKQPGPIKQAQEQLTAYHIRLGEYQQLLIVQQKRLKEKKDIEKHLQVLQEQLDINTYLLDLHQKKNNLNQRLDELQEQDKQFDQIHLRQQGVRAELAGLQQVMEASPLQHLTASQIETLSEKYEEKQQLEMLMEKELTENKSLSGNDQLLTITGWVLTLGGIGLMLIQWLVALLILTLGMTVLVLVGRSQQARNSEIRKKLEARQQYVKQLQEIEGFLQAWHDKVGLAYTPQLKKDWQALQLVKAKFDALSDQVKTDYRLDDEKWQAVRRSLRLVQDELNDPDMQMIELDPQAFIALKTKVASWEKERGDQQRRRDHLQAFINQERVNQELISEVEERIQSVQSRLGYLKARLKLGTRIVAYLKRARQATMNPAKQIIEQRAGELLSQFTMGNYRQLSLDDNDLSSKVLIAETERWEDPALLSQGAFDQLYLSLRLAMSEVLTGGKKSPLLLDEPLSSFDEQRFAAAVASLKMMAQSRQIILFSCRKDYNHYADHLIELG